MYFSHPQNRPWQPTAVYYTAHTAVDLSDQTSCVSVHPVTLSTPTARLVTVSEPIRSLVPVMDHAVIVDDDVTCL